ncbi:membrane protein of unknown function [Burkholderia multivorans]
MITWSFVLCAASLALAGICHASSVYVVALFCALSLGLMAAGFITAYVYTPEQYPTSIRASGCGLGSAWLKIASFVAPMVVPHAIVGGNLSPAFYLLGVVPLLAAERRRSASHSPVIFDEPFFCCGARSRAYCTAVTGMFEMRTRRSRMPRWKNDRRV